MIETGNNSALKTVIDTSRNIRAGVGCTIEYNYNAMVNSPTISSSGSIQQTSFTKLFPVDSLTKPNRPVAAGIKYYINGDVISKEYLDQKGISKAKPFRIYVPGSDNLYKYYLSGNKGSSDNISISYSKKILVNKVVVKFELSHGVPSSFSIYGTPYGGSSTLLKSGVSSDVPQFGDVKTYKEGKVAIYYTGSGWSFSENDLDPTKYIEMSEIKLLASVGSSSYLGIIEFSPRYVIDISDDIVQLSIDKSTSANQSDALPVGYVNANTLSLNLVRYNKLGIKIKSYDKTDTLLEPNTIYFYKMAEVKPYIKIFHSNGLLGSSDKYDKIPQGSFYMDTSNIQEYGDATIDCLDGSKMLQEIIPQDSLCERYSIIGIISRMLDNVGFTNYFFHVTDSDQSLISPLYWWTDDTKTVWEHIQELCRDSQMTAIFDENNVLRFYSRDYMYGRSSVDWTMRNKESGSNLANIVDMSKQDLPSMNQVKVLWQTPQIAVNDQNSGDLIWQAPVSYLAAFELTQAIPSTAIAGSYMSLKAVAIDDYTKQLWEQTFSGFILVNDEVIEYDALEYRYRLPNSIIWQTPVDITNSSDLLKYKAIADQAANGIEPTGRFRIKTRGALGTQAKIQTHSASYKEILSSWSTLAGVFSTGTTVPADPTASPSSSITWANTSQSLLNITNIDKTANSFKIAMKGNWPVASYSSSPVYNSYGTTMFLNPADNNSSIGNSLNSVGGFAFHVNSIADTMYLLRIQTSIVTNASITGSKTSPKDVELYKIVNGKMSLMSSTQSALRQITNITQGEVYKIDISVETTSNKNNIKITINGDTFAVQDSTDRLAPTSYVGLVAIQNKSSFDYVYATKIDKASYADNNGFNIYTGKYSEQTLNFLFGNKIFNDNGEQVSSAVEDFGPVAREIRQDIVRYSTRPAYPLMPSLGSNKLVNFIGSRMSPFGAEMYVINNSGTYIPISDTQASSYFIAGKTLSKSGSLEYKNYTVNEFTVEEPVIFESIWLQSEGDVKNLASWIKTQWAKKQSVVTMNIFGNPMISVGDIIDIDYDYQELKAGQKFVISNVVQNYTNGLETSIVCRTL